MLYQINYQNIYGCFKFPLIKTTTESAMQGRKLVSLPSLLTVDSGWHYEYKLPSISQWGQIIFEFAFAFDLQNIYFFVNYLLLFLDFLHWNNRKYLKKLFNCDFKKRLTPLCSTGSIVSLYASTSIKKTV